MRYHGGIGTGHAQAPNHAARMVFYCTNGGVLPEIVDLRKGMI